jgi:hypothetical protein
MGGPALAIASAREIGGYVRRWLAKGAPELVHPSPQLPALVAARRDNPDPLAIRC